MAKVSWLHISDTHILRPSDNPKAESFNQEHVLKRFLEFIAERFPSDQIEKPRYLFVTGDLAFRGKKEDYENTNSYSVKKMISKIAEAIGIGKEDYRERIFPVAGNHDVDRDTLTDKHDERANLETARDIDALNDLFLNDAKKGKRARILCRSKAYCDFVRNLWGEADLTDEQVLWYTRSLGIDGSDQRLHLVALDSAWLCHSHRLAHMKGAVSAGRGEPTSHLRQPEALLDSLFHDIRDDGLTIALMHHDYEITGDRNTGVQHLLESKCDFILCGHEHSERWATPTLGRAHKIRAGCFYERRGRRNSVNIVEVDTSAGQAKMLTIHYRPDQGGFWAPDRDRDPTGGQAGYVFRPANGVMSFYLNQPDRPVKQPTLATSVPSGLNARWRECLDGARSSIVNVIGQVYGNNEGDFWLVVDETEFRNRSRIAGENFRQRVNALLRLCTYHTEYPIVLEIFERLAMDCPGVDAFRVMLEELKKRGEAR